MTRAAANNRVSDAAWGCESLRCTIFHSPNETPNVAGEWERVAGTPPDAVTAKPKNREHIETGKVEQWQFVLHAQRGRIDWVLAAGDEPGDQQPIFPEIATYFLNLMGNWFRGAELPKVSRLAFGAVVGLPVPDVAAGYRTLCDYLPFDIDYSVSSDFMYQINRRRESQTIPEVVINRLTKWSVTKVTKVTFVNMDAGLRAIQDPETGPCCCRLELDINTVPGADTELDTQQLAPLHQELVFLGREIIREGDIQ